MKEIAALKEVLEGKTSFLLIAHESPDGDAIGATLAFAQFLEDRGKTVGLASKDPVPSFFSFLHGSHRLSNDFLIGDWEVIVLIDNGDLKRTGFADRILAAKDRGVLVINIDHHPQNDIWKIAALNIAYPRLSSTSEIVFNIFKHFDYQISPAVATNLMAGIYYDTGGFLHPNTSDAVMNIASELLRLGASHKRVSRSVHQNKSVSMLKLWGAALSNLKILAKYGLAYAVLLRDDIEKSGASEEEISGLVGMINTTAEAEASLLIYETQDGKIKGSLRTESDKIDVSRLAKALGGGGHKRAAGFSIDGHIVRSGTGWQIK